MKYLTFLFCLFLFEIDTSLQAAPIEKSTQLVEGTLVTEVHLNLALLDKVDNTEIAQQRQEMDNRSIFLQKGEKLIVVLDKNLSNSSSPSSGIGYFVENNIIVRSWNGWINFLWGQEPLKLIRQPLEEKDCNYYYYETTQIGGIIDLSFIAHTYPRYYSSLHVFIQ